MKLIFQLIVGDKDCFQHVPSDTSSELMNTRHCWRCCHALRQRLSQGNRKNTEHFPAHDDREEKQNETLLNFLKQYFPIWLFSLFFQLD